MGSACSFRWSRFLGLDSGRGIIVPLDHGLTSGPIAGIAKMSDVASWISHPAINGVILHKGYAAALLNANALRGKALCIHLNGMASVADAPERKETLTRIESAIRLGADAVSIELVFNGFTDAANLRIAGAIVDEASAFQLPVLVMLKSVYTAAAATDNVRATRHLARSMAELGVQAVKLARPAHSDLLPDLLRDIADDIDVFFAGGERDDDAGVLGFAADALTHGARGVCIGRNVFQNPHPAAFLDRLDRIARCQPRPAKLYSGR